MATFGERLKLLRMEKHLRQEDTAEIFGVTKGTVSVWERDIRKPDFETLTVIAAHYNVTMGYLLGTEDERRIPSQPSEEDAATWAMEDEEEELTRCAKMLSELSPSTRTVVLATLNAAYKMDRANDALREGQFNVMITNKWLDEKRKK